LTPEQFLTVQRLVPTHLAKKPKGRTVFLAEEQNTDHDCRISY